MIGPLAPGAADRLGLPAGLPVLVGGGDYPVALLGSGVMAPGMASDVTGTSTIITLLHDAPVIDPEVSNVATVEGHWGSLTLLDAGGDAVRWARRAFHENRRGYAEVSDVAAPGRGGRRRPVLPALPLRRAVRRAPQLARPVLRPDRRRTACPSCTAPCSRASPSRSG